MDLVDTSSCAFRPNGELFERELFGQNDQVGPEALDTPDSANTCPWCRLMRDGDRVVYEEQAFVLLEGSSKTRRGSVTLVTKAHVNLLTELAPQEMAAVLAALTRASERMRRTSGAAGVKIRPGPSSWLTGPGHLHFELVPEAPGSGAAPSAPLDSPTALASLLEAISR